MARTNWDFYGVGGWEVSTAQAVSPTHSFKPVSGYQVMIFNGNTSLLNSRVEFSLKVTQNHPGLSPYWGFGAVARASQPLIGPATTLYYVSLRGVSVDEIGYSMGKWKAGAYTNLMNGSSPVVPAGTGFSGWHKFRFSVTDEFGESVLRLDAWNVSVWDQWVQIADAGAGRIDAAGGAGLYQFMGTYPAGSAYFDDVSVFELT